MGIFDFFWTSRSKRSVLVGGLKSTARLRPIPSNRDIDEVAFLTNRQMKAEQRKLPGESKYPVVS
jgi:hypothetical protein